MHIARLSAHTLPVVWFWQQTVCRLCFSHGWSAMDQMACDSNCCIDRRASIFDHHLGGIYLALGSVNRLTGRVAAICSIFNANAGAIPDAHSHRSACTKGNTRSYPDSEPDAVTKFPGCWANASTTQTPSPITRIASNNGALISQPLTPRCVCVC